MINKYVFNTGINDMAIAYGVAMNKLKLHIPSTCPEDWRWENETLSWTKNISIWSLENCPPWSFYLLGIQNFLLYIYIRRDTELCSNCKLLICAACWWKAVGSMTAMTGHPLPPSCRWNPLALYEIYKKVVEFRPMYPIFEFNEFLNQKCGLKHKKKCLLQKW